MALRIIELHGQGVSALDRRWSIQLERAKNILLDDWKCGRQGWMGCPDATLGSVRRVVNMRRFTTLLVIGIGGSDLGARAAWHALRASSKGLQLEFIGNTDPDELDEVFHRLDWRRTLINIISKSGDTLEPMSLFFAARERLIMRVGHTQARTQIVATTDEHEGSLRALARREGYATLPIPRNIGGRFSVLTPVGLFPLFCAGFQLDSLLRGAKKIRDAFLQEAPLRNIVCRYAAMLVRAHREQGRAIHVWMPYSERLRVFMIWVRQLWAESLGKEGRGPTPIAALGATDQHSQLQLYLDGPEDKFVTFFEVEKFASRLRVPPTIREIPTLGFLARKSFQEILHAERAGTVAALASRARPSVTLTIPRVTEETLGALFMFFLVTTGIAGELYGVNTYDQPAVEHGKQRIRAILGG